MAQKLSNDAQEARRAYQREYQKEWRRKNPDKAKAITARYWEKVAAQAKAAQETAPEPRE